MARILYLEDRILDATLVQHLVKRCNQNAEVHVVADSDSFLNELDQNPYNIVLCDNSFAGLDTLSALNAVKKRQPQATFIVLTGHVDESRAVAALAAGATDYINKAEPWRLRHRLEQLFSDSKGPDQVTIANSGQSADLLLRTIQQLSAVRSIDDVARIVRSAARALVAADGATFVLRQREECFYADEDAVSPLWKGRRFPLSTCISGWVMINAQQVVIPDIYVDERIPHDAYRPTFVQSLVMTPVRKESPVAAIGTYWADNHIATVEEIALLQLLANTTAVALENVNLYNELEQRVEERTLQLAAANKELDSFAHAVSHDLRAPLSGIGSVLDYLLADYQDVLPAACKNSIQVASTESKRMTNMVTDLLRLSKLSHGELQKTSVDLSSMARQTLSRAAAGTPNLTSEVGENLTVFADAGLMEVVLENLLSNACKYSSKADKPHVTFGTRLHESGKQVFFVRDNGCGFDSAKARNLFGVFQRFHSDNDYPGTGVGLATVQRAIHKHGGEIWAESTPGCGATFYFCLPQKDI